MLEQPGGLLLHQLGDHVAEHGPDGIEALVRGADVVEAIVVEEDLLDDEDGDRLAQLRSGLHDAEAKRDDLSREEKVNHLRGVILDERADHSKGRQPEILERPRFRCSVQERVEKERNVRCRRETLAN